MYDLAENDQSKVLKSAESDLLTPKVDHMQKSKRLQSLSRVNILTRDTDIAILSVRSVRLSVGPSVCPSVTFPYSMETV